MNTWILRSLVVGGCLVVCVVVGVVVFFLTKNAYGYSNNTSNSSSSATVDLLAFPDGFMIGCATASYQVEGAWNESGKGENIWDRFTHNESTKSYIANEDNGDVACDSYHLYKTDVQMIKQTGFDFYRFSISWSRVLPNGTTDYVNPDGIQYYHNLINECLAYNITPLVTLFHWDMPQPLQELGGFVNSSIADYFLDYADLMFLEYGSKVKWWLTINEPSSVLYGYFSKAYAPGLNLPGILDYKAAHNMLRCHGKVYKLYNETYKPTQQGKLGIDLHSYSFVPENESSTADQEATAREWAFYIEIFSHPIYSKEGNYPAVVRERVDKNSFAENRTESRLPYFTDQEVDEIRGSYDFFGVNNYLLGTVSNGTTGEDPSMTRDSGANYTTSYRGDSLKLLLVWIKKKYDNPPVLVLENGCSSNKTLNDTTRIQKYHAFIKGMLEAIYEEGCNVIGYTVWSIMDNFEWTSGYTYKYGLWDVDFDDANRTRTMKQSGYWFQNLLANRRLPNTTGYMSS